MTTINPADVKLSRDEFLNLMLGLNRPVITTIEAVTKAHKMKVKGNPLRDRVTVHAVVNGIIGSWNYGSAVNNRRMVEWNPQTQAEADAVPIFEPLPRSWGDRIPNSALVNYKDRFYVEIKCNSCVKRTWLVDNRAATPQEVAIIESFITPTEEGKRQELDKPVVLRDYGLESIRSLKLDGQVIAVVDS